MTDRLREQTDIPKPKLEGFELSRVPYSQQVAIREHGIKLESTVAHGWAPTIRLILPVGTEVVYTFPDGKKIPIKLWEDFDPYSIIFLEPDTKTFIVQKMSGNKLQITIADKDGVFYADITKPVWAIKYQRMNEYETLVYWNQDFWQKFWWQLWSNLTLRPNNKVTAYSLDEKPLKEFPHGSTITFLYVTQITKNSDGSFTLIKKDGYPSVKIRFEEGWKSVSPTNSLSSEYRTHLQKTPLPTPKKGGMFDISTPDTENIL